MLRILGRHDDRHGKANKKDDSYKRGEPDGSEEVTALHKTKKQRSKRSKNDVVDHETSVTYVGDESDMEMYPLKHDEANGLSGSTK